MISLTQIIVDVCKKHNVRALELTDRHISIISDCMEEYAAQSAPKQSAGVEESQDEIFCDFVFQFMREGKNINTLKKQFIIKRTDNGK